MMRKRLLCAALALAMFFPAQSAAAAAQTGNIRSMIINANTRLPTINVTVASTGKAFINPYMLDVEIDGEDTNEQIICEPCGIINESDIPLAVDVTVTGTINSGSDMSLATSSTRSSTSKTKKAFVYFEIQLSETDDPDDVQWDDAYNSKKHIRFTTSGASTTKTNVLTLAAMTPFGDIANGGCAAFRVTGDAIEAPKNEWTEQDGLSVEVAFTFTPVPYC